MAQFTLGAGDLRACACSVDRSWMLEINHDSRMEFVAFLRCTSIALAAESYMRANYYWLVPPLSPEGDECSPRLQTSDYTEEATHFYCAMLCMRGTSHGPVSVCLSVTSQSSTKTAKRRITQTKPHDSSGTLVFWCQKGSDPAVEFRGDLWHQKTRVPGLSCGVVCVILRLAVLVELW